MLSQRQAAGAADGGEFWALLSDTHIAADESAEARGVVLAAQFRRVLKQVAAAGAKPHGVLINGDCALKDGQPEDYAQFLRCVKPLLDENIQVHCTLGNHDDRRHFSAATTQPGVEPLLADRHVTVLSSARINWVLLDSLDAVNATPGRLGESQLGWLQRTLWRLPDKPAVVVLHHDPQTFVAEGAKLTGLADAGSLLGVLRKNPRVKALIHGHTHNWNVQPPADGNPWIIGLPPVAYVFNPDRPAGWVMARVNGERLTLELRALNPDHPQHRQRVEVELM